VRLAPADGAFRLAAAAACWTLSEWLRGWLFTGFPWLAVGYAQVPGPLAGYAPLGGVFLASLAIAGSAALAVHLATVLEARRHRAAFAATAALVALWAAGFALRGVEWSHPVRDPVSVSLIQGNVEQDVKFEGAYREITLAIYADLVAQAQGRLIVLPESALPMFANEVPAEYVARLRAAAQERSGDLLVGLFFSEPGEGADEEDRYFNSVVSVGVATTQVYRKRHLVPFGETIPLKPITGWFLHRVLHIPIADQTPGPADQPPFEVAGERVAVNICYEDAFGSEIARELPAATLLVNVTNDAWYGHSLAAEQHEQIAAMRAVETARPMLRATNTGITSIIDHRGRELARLPWFTRGVLEGSIAGREGQTPYVLVRDAPPIAIALVLVVVCFARGRARHDSAR
jgi:apolipoprotein N-acyltransferase